MFELLVGLALAGCGSEDPSGAGPGSGGTGAAFVGNWKCSTKGTDVNANVSTTFDTVYVGQDLGNGQISLIRPDLNCAAVKFTVSGNTATALPGQTCPRPDGSTLSYQSYTATSDGTILTMEEHDEFSGSTTRYTYTSTCYHP